MSTRKKVEMSVAQKTQALEEIAVEARATNAALDNAQRGLALGLLTQAEYDAKRDELLKRAMRFFKRKVDITIGLEVEDDFIEHLAKVVSHTVPVDPRQEDEATRGLYLAYTAGLGDPYVPLGPDYTAGLNPVFERDAVVGYMSALVGEPVEYGFRDVFFTVLPRPSGLGSGPRAVLNNRCYRDTARVMYAMYTAGKKRRPAGAPDEVGDTTKLDAARNLLKQRGLLATALAGARCEHCNCQLRDVPGWETLVGPGAGAVTVCNGCAEQPQYAGLERLVTSANFAD